MQIFRRLAEHPATRFVGEQIVGQAKQSAGSSDSILYRHCTEDNDQRRRLLAKDRQQSTAVLAETLEGHP